MRFLVDECTGPAVARWLRAEGHQVFSVYDEARGMDDEQVIQKAFADNWILITNDKDFGQRVYRERRPHRGVVLLLPPSYAKRFLLVCLVVLLAGCLHPTAAPGFPSRPSGPAGVAPPIATRPASGWRTSTPEQQGIDSATLARMLEAVEKQRLDIHGLVLVRNGYIVAEAYFQPYRQSTRHELYSCTKSFVATLVGIAIDKGYIAGVDRRVLSFFPRRTFASPDGHKGAMTLEHLLTMTAGLEWAEGDPAYRRMYASDDWLRFMLDRPMAEDPGSRFNYCSGCSHVLSAIVQESTGMPTLRFARQYLFEPLGIADVAWETDAQGIPIGGWGLRLTPRDMAKLGQLYLDGGTWEGREIVSAAWIQAAVSWHVATDGPLGYGYQWWTYPEWGAYTARGRGGQLIFVIPGLKIVAVFTAGDQDDHAFFTLIKDYIVPAVRSSEPLPENPEGQAALKALAEAAAEP